MTELKPKIKEGIYDHRAIEEEVLRYWQEARVPQRLGEKRAGAQKFFLLDGPPYINALPHVGHVKTTASKDIWTRLKYMQGFDCLLQPGFDCHGLPVEVIVEKELGIKTKQEIEEFGVKKFDDACLQKILNNERAWMEYYKLLGAWRGFFEPYFTYKNYYIESAWWTLKQLDEKGFLYEGLKAIHWCPHCETALSGYEVSDSYKDVTDPSIYVKFKLKGKGKENEFLAVFTTTPWTLPANVAVFVHPSEVYVKVRVEAEGGGKEVLIVAKARVKPFFEETLGKEYAVIEEFPGKALEGLEYESLVECEQQREVRANAKALRVYMSLPLMKGKIYKKHVMKTEQESNAGAKPGEQSGEQPRGAREEFGEFVTMEDGTGLVHCAPGHGQTDNLIGKEYGLPAVSPVDERGCFTEKVEWLRGKFVKKADREIVEWLKKEGKLLHYSTITHSYPLCWRCKSPLVFRLSKQWYLKIDAIKDALVRANEETKWMPAYGKQAMHNWLADAQDWCVSQQRFWGIPMPIWVCGKCGARRVVGSVAELREQAMEDPGALEDLHRHSVDGIKLRCKCGGEASRVKDIFNVWFDSAVSPWASLGYPARNKELFEKVFPVHLICESQDQIRGWFYVLAFTATAAFSKPAYERCAMMGWVVDEKGEKMSKSLGNVIGAREGIEKLGGDAIRLYYCWEIAPWDVQKFSLHSAQEVTKTLNILWNSYAFFKTYAPHGFRASATRFEPKALEDSWIASRLNTTIREVAAHAEEFEFHHAGRKAMNFVVEDFSRWFIKLSRDRMSANADAREKLECANALHYVFANTLKLLAPFCPFITEYVYADLKQFGAEKEESIHYARFPEPDARLVDAELEKQMSFAIAATEAVNSLRREAGIKNRWPVREVVVCGGADARKAVEKLEELLLAATNSLSVSFSENPPSAPGMLSRELADGAKVFLNPARDEELANQSLFREVVRAIQSARKQNGFVVSEKIVLIVWANNERAREFLKENAERLLNEVSALTLTLASDESELGKGFEAQAKLEDAVVKARFSRS